VNEEALTLWGLSRQKQTKYSKESTVQIQGKKALYKFVLSVRPYVRLEQISCYQALSF
jgi:hypothetical protein